MTDLAQHYTHLEGSAVKLSARKSYVPKKWDLAGLHGISDDTLTAPRNRAELWQPLASE